MRWPFAITTLLLGAILASAAEIPEPPPDDVPLEVASGLSDGAVRMSISSEFDEADESAEFASFRMQEPVQPAPPISLMPGTGLPAPATEFAAQFFTTDSVRRSLIAQSRGGPLPDVGAEFVFGSEGEFRATTDTGNLLGKALSTPSVTTQQRSPIVNDPRVRGSQTGRLIASGSYWAPARQDLDTALSKIDSALVKDIIVIKGPYAAHYGPAYRFVDFQLLESPRFFDGPEVHGSAFAEYNTNGQQWYGRGSAWGGDDHSGWRASYGHRTGNDYLDGSGAKVPASYNSRDLDIAYGYDFTPDSHIELNYLRLDQTNVEFPTLVFDINWLVTDGYEATYVLENQTQFDLLVVDGWYNRTRFEGDTSRPSKNIQIPAIRQENNLGPNQFLTTDVDGMSAGYRVAMSWGGDEEPLLTVGTDLIRLGQQLNDIVPEHTEDFFGDQITIPEQNFPIPRSESLDVGIFVEHSRPVTDELRVNLGARVDMIQTNARNNVPGMGVLDFSFFPPGATLVPTSLSDLKQAGLQQNFTPWALYLTADYQINDWYSCNAGVGEAMRPPTLTELYAAGPFIGALQPGLTFVQGDPELDPEQCTQIDIGMRSDLGYRRWSASGFYSWIHNYITYDSLYLQPDPFEPGQDFQQAAYTNTDLATLIGFELIGEEDVRDDVTAFAIMNYVAGTDHTRRRPSRIGAIIREENLFPPGPRSLYPGSTEALPGIPPLQARLGLRWHDPCPVQNWALELEARVVAEQTRVATSLYEQRTPGFTVWNLRGFVRPTNTLTLIGGVENFTNRYYREHLDFRSGIGTFRPGVNFYSAVELVF